MERIIEFAPVPMNVWSSRVDPNCHDDAALAVAFELGHMNQ